MTAYFRLAFSQANTTAGFLLLLVSLPSFAASAPSSTPSPPAERASITPEQVVNRPKRMDGVTLEAVETYVNPKTNEISLGIGVYPFDAYYYGLSVNAGYTYHIDRNFAWEVLNVQYYASFQKPLTTELANIYSVNPKSITSLNYVFSSDIQYIFAYGKFTVLEEQIRYFRASAIGGLAAIKTSSNNTFAGLFGVKFQVFTRESFSWNVEFRDNLAINGNNYLTFILGTGLSF
ncbi:MAG: hypothetical protein H7333_08140 [Bdellovibrionales bacterium]|nr:hypothetical protein [Oligoflexia bacterium]